MKASEKNSSDTKLQKDVFHHCCEINCKNEAEFHVQDIGMGTNYEDYTECCAKHLPQMINDIHQVCRIEKE